MRLASLSLEVTGSGLESNTPLASWSKHSVVIHSRPPHHWVSLDTSCMQDFISLEYHFPLQQVKFSCCTSLLTTSLVDIDTQQ